MLLPGVTVREVERVVIVVTVMKVTSVGTLVIVRTEVMVVTHSGFAPSDWPIWTDFVGQKFKRRILFL